MRVTPELSLTAALVLLTDLKVETAELAMVGAAIRHIKEALEMIVADQLAMGDALSKIEDKLAQINALV